MKVYAGAATPPLARRVLYIWPWLVFLIPAAILLVWGGVQAAEMMWPQWGGSAARPRPEAPKQALRDGPPLVLPASDPAALRAVSPEGAEAINATIAPSSLPNPAAIPWHGAAGNLDLTRSVGCLTAAVYYEAGSEPISGQEAVAQVVLNRVRHPAFPHSVCGVVFEGAERRTGCQFSFTCDGSLARVPSKLGWARARAVAEWALAGNVYRPVGWATHYHADYVVPYWAFTLAKVVTVGRHIFYRWNGDWGAARVFSARYTGLETELSSEDALAKIGVDTSSNLVAPSGEPALAPLTSRPILSNAQPNAQLAGAPPPGVTAAQPGALAGRRWVLGAPDTNATSPDLAAAGK